jgi:SAM-dependent methyltransferase
MSIEKAYNEWASQYDTNKNKTRDLEALALAETLEEISFDKCLEIGCGTGKNTAWLIQKAGQVLAIDLSAGMLEKAKAKIPSERVTFRQADITKSWNFGNGFDLVSFSLVLEHIENLDPVFEEAGKALKTGGYVYIGELHPFKQYGGTKARFDTENGRQEVTCFTHHISDFIKAGKKYGFELTNINEFFDDDDKTTVPRILTVLLKKSDPNV